MSALSPSGQPSPVAALGSRHRARSRSPPIETLCLFVTARSDFDVRKPTRPSNVAGTVSDGWPLHPAPGATTGRVHADEVASSLRPNRRACRLTAGAGSSPAGLPCSSNPREPCRSAWAGSRSSYTKVYRERPEAEAARHLPVPAADDRALRAASAAWAGATVDLPDPRSRRRRRLGRWAAASARGQDDAGHREPDEQTHGSTIRAAPRGSL